MPLRQEDARVHRSRLRGSRQPAVCARAPAAGPRRRPDEIGGCGDARSGIRRGFPPAPVLRVSRSCPGVARADRQSRRQTLDGRALTGPPPEADVMLALVYALTFLHHAGAQMRSPVLPLYAAAHGATPTDVGLIIGAHMAVAAIGSIPLGWCSDRWGRRPLLLGGMAVATATSLLLPLAESQIALTVIYGLAGLGITAFTPSALSLVGDTAPEARAGQAYAWYSTAHYGAIAIGPFLGGL